MYLILILFFGSFIGITFMIGKKLLMLQSGQISYNDNEETFLKAQYFEELKHSAVKTIKKHRYTGLVTIVRIYVRSSNFIKNKYEQVKIKIKEIYCKKIRSNSVIKEKQEVPKFLKIISEYKQKIREIRHKIREEENL
ncbi:MAG: hypothetical protein PHT16_01905 [Candidatus Pacebacteria bacterium]|nr:hypothetical protein [Candidatus Paceibacterota bacterium]